MKTMNLLLCGGSMSSMLRAGKNIRDRRQKERVKQSRNNINEDGFFKKFGILI